MTASLRLGFAGTPPFAATILSALIDSGHTLELVLTQPDRPTGRGRKLRPSPVKSLALARGLPVRDPSSLAGESLAGDNLDLLVVAAYGLILPDHILTAPRLGCLNVHASLLPRWRGAAPVERAIMAGDTETGVCLMQMDTGLDTGPVYTCERVTIGAEETGGELEARLALLGGELLRSLLPKIENLTPEPQPASGATYAHKLTAADALVDWDHPADQLARQIRALVDRRPATALAAGEEARIRILAARAVSAPHEQHPGTILSADRQGLVVACGSGSIRITRVQLNRGKGTPMDAAAAANGYPDLLSVGSVLLNGDGTDPARSVG
jgi:methionyl-tRNA formyltransferase